MTAADRAALVEQLIDDEDEVLFVYDDKTGKRLHPGDVIKGKPTIGVGRNLYDKGLTEEESRYLLGNDIDECVQDLVTFPWFLDLDAVRKRAMVSMRMNLGPDRFREFKGMFARLDDHDYAGAADHMRFSLWHRQTKRRARRIEQMMRTGVDPGPQDRL